MAKAKPRVAAAAPGAAATSKSSRSKKLRTTTSFEARLYELCKLVPRGKVTTYGSLAKALNSCARAVGQGMRRNPFAPIVPCHRVIASTLALGGFNGSWGAGTSEVQRKLGMLQEEGVAFKDGKVASSGCVLDDAQLRKLADEAGVKLV